jgi:hypothetical protein
LADFGRIDAPASKIVEVFGGDDNKGSPKRMCPRPHSDGLLDILAGPH